MKLKVLLLVAILSTISLAGFSQEACSKYSLKNRFSVELGGGHSRTVVKPGGFKVSEGMGVDAIIGFNAYKNFGVYAGWGWNNFSNEHFDFEETGYMYGIQYKNAFKESKFSYTLRAEGAHDSDFDGFYYDSGHGLGFHSSGALEYSLGKGWGINATVKYHQLNRTVVLPDSELLPTPGETNYNIHLKYIGLRIGIVKNF